MNKKNRVSYQDLQSGILNRNSKETGLLYLILNISMDTISGMLVESNKSKKISVLSYFSEKSDGLSDGTIQNIDKVYESVNKLIVSLKESSNLDSIQNALSIIGIDDSKGQRLTETMSVNFVEGEITRAEIDRVMQGALFNANIPDHLKLINMTSSKFKVDTNERINNPVGLMCGKLEVDVSMQLSKNSYFNNIGKVLKRNNFGIDYMRLDSDNIVDSILTDDEKEDGAILVIVHKDTINIMFVKHGYMNNTSIITSGYNDIVQQIAIKFKLTYKEAKTIYTMSDKIIESSKAKGYFELEKTDNKIVQIKISDFISVLNTGLTTLFSKVKTEIHYSNNFSSYLNGLILLDNFNSEYLSDNFTAVFKEEVREIRDHDEVISINSDFINGLELIKKDYALIGLARMLTHESKFECNHDLTIITRGNSFIGKGQLSNSPVSNSKKEVEKNTYWQKAKQKFLEIW